MGGRLFTCRRYYTGDLLKLSFDIGILLSTQHVKWSYIPFLTEKKDHGDLDIIVSRYSVSYDFLKYISENFEFKINGKVSGIKNVNNIDVLSFLYEELQVDLIFIDEPSFDFAVHYHSYNDLGGIIGSCIRPIGVVLGREGFYYNYESLPSTGVRKVYLTKNFRKFLDAVELNDDIFYGGRKLNDVGDMVEYLKDWKFFNVDYINPENMNATRKNRARKRSTFVGFIEEAEKRGLSSNYRKEDYGVEYFIEKFDSTFINDQINQIDKIAEKIVNDRYMFSLQRMEKVLGYSPTNYGEVFRIFSKTYPRPKEVATNMTDSDFKDALEKIIEKIKKS